ICLCAGLCDRLHLVSGVLDLKVLPVYQPPANAADLLAAPAMQNVIGSLRQSFEYIVIDSPPVIPFSDARTLAGLSDGVILVGRYAQTTRRAMARSAELFADVNAPGLCVVLNDMDFSSPDYQYFNYGYTWGNSSRKYGYTKRLAEAAVHSDKNQPPRAKGAHA